MPRYGRRPGEFRDHPAQAVDLPAADEVVDGEGALREREAHRDPGGQPDQRRLHRRERQQGVLAQGAGQQAAVDLVEELGIRGAPAGLAVAGNALLKPDRGAVGAQEHEQIVQILVVQGVAPGIAARQQPRREDHDLVVRADAHRAAGFDVAPGEARDPLEILDGRRDLDAHLPRRPLAEPPPDRAVAGLERLQRRLGEHPVALGIEAQDEVLALDARKAVVHGEARGSEAGEGCDRLQGGDGRRHLAEQPHRLAVVPGQVGDARPQQKVLRLPGVAEPRERLPRPRHIPALERRRRRAPSDAVDAVRECDSWLRQLLGGERNRHDGGSSQKIDRKPGLSTANARGGQTAQKDPAAARGAGRREGFSCKAGKSLRTAAHDRAPQ